MPPPADPRQPVGREPRAEAEHVPEDVPERVGAVQGAIRCLRARGQCRSSARKSAAFTQPWVSGLRVRVWVAARLDGEI